MPNQISTTLTTSYYGVWKSNTDRANLLSSIYLDNIELGKSECS